MSGKPPKRLVHIGTLWQQERPVDLRLIEDMTHNINYIALSHRWGAQRQYVTTSENLLDRLRRIVWDELSLSYRDAILVAHELGIEYIW